VSQDILKTGVRHCYACIQWDGRRSYDSANASIKTDPGSEGLCRVKHRQVKGNLHCDLFFPLK
jgi:hypothetical protein